jgi:DNA-directed RNA polymerase subunit H (RpoH/RPB5)
MAEKKATKKVKKVSEKSEKIKETKKVIELKKHVMVPKHEVFPEKEVGQLLTKYNITREQLPSILIGDPALKGLDIKNGDIMKVTRENEVTGTSYVYRIVVSL